MATTGMNLAEVRQLADRLRQAAEELRHIVSTVDGRVAHSSWNGTDADRFKHQWWPGHRSMVLQSADDLQGLAQSASNNANEQEQVSSVSGRVGTAPDSLSGAFLTLTGLMSAIGLTISGEGATTAEAWQKFIKDPTVALTVARSIERARGVSAGGSSTIDGVPVSYNASAEVYAKAYSTAGVTLDSSGLALAATAGAVIGARAGVDGAIGNQYLGATGSASVEAEAGVKGSAEAKFGPSGATGALHGEIGASVSASAAAHAHLSGVEAGATAHVYAGVSAHADITGSATIDEVKTHVDLGASLGIGGGVGFDIDVKPAQVFADTGRLATKWTNGWQL